MSRHGFLRWFGWSMAAHIALGTAFWVALPRVHAPIPGESDAAVTLISLIDDSFDASPTRPATRTLVSPSPSASVHARTRAVSPSTAEPAPTNDPAPSDPPAPATTDAAPAPIETTGTSPVDWADPSTDPAVEPSDARDDGTVVATEPSSMPGAPDDYRPLVLAILERAKRYPLVARRWGIEGVVDIAFTIHPNGQLSDPELVASSMHQVLDDAALALVRRVRFVPPPPTRTPMRFSALIQYQVDP